MDTLKEDHNRNCKTFLQLARLSSGSPIKAFLALKEISQTDLAKKIEVHPSDISTVISGKRKTHWIRRAIAQELNIPVNVLFGTVDKNGAAEEILGSHRSILKVEIPS